jgi:chromosome segregation protein
MKLTKVEMYGFKSFADRTEFTFGDGITGIVGPNGCGKSNLVDALQWTLGEQRPTKLRSSGMEDVVFRGDAASVDHAEVSLTFDNSDQRLPHPAAEVKITRRLERGAGESTYSINDTVVRLKDVRDLFLDTGLGVGGYSFMAQGQIDAILRASPAERRVLIEEAAGTSRYRVRRKESVRRLDRTEQDIQRASDLLTELERQVRSLKIQAGRARTYVEKRDRLRSLLAVLFARRRRELSSLLAELVAEKDAAAERERTARAELATVEETLAARDDQQAALATAISDVRTGLAERRARAEHLASRLAELDARRAELSTEREESAARQTEVASQIGSLAQSEKEADARVHEVAAKERAQRDARGQAQRRLDELARGTQELEARLQELEKDELDLVEEEQRARSELGDADSHANVLAQSRQKVEARSAERARAIADAAAVARELDRKVEALVAERAALEAELSSDDAELGRLFRESHSLGDRLRHREARIEGERSRLLVVEEAIARHEGVSEVVRRLLERAAHGDPELEGIEGIVADLVTAPAETARALEAALGPLSEALVVHDRAAANRILKVLRGEGLERIHLLSRAEIPGGGDALATPIASEILRASTFDPKDRELLTALLGRFDLLGGGATMESATPAAGRALVSAEGEVMLSAWEHVSRGRGEFLGLITRRNERERLTRSVAAGESESGELRAQVAKLQEEIALRERDRDARAKRRDEAQEREGEAEREAQAAENRLALLRDELAVDARELVDLDRRLAALEVERRELAAKRAAVEARRLQVRGQRSAIAEKLQAGDGERQRAEEKLVALDVEVATLAERVKAAGDAREAARTRLRERNEELKLAERRVAELSEEDARLVQAKEQGGAERLGLLAEIEGQTAALAQRQADLEKHKQETGTLRHRVHELRAGGESAARDVQSLELKEQERRLTFQMLADKVREELLLDPEEIARQVADVEEGRAATITLPAPPPPAPEPAPLAEPATAAESGETNGTAIAATNGTTFEAAILPPLPPPPPPAPIVLELDPKLFAAPLDGLQAEAERLKSSIARLGPVNVIAIDELEAVEGRATFLQKQRTDLLEARQKLRELIDEIDRECETRFTKTYDAVREHFRHLFRRLFGGGRADLNLVETEDPSEMGVDIVAAPPGKDPRSITMLSGGERTLTAAALLFALFSTRPSPFCVLDEVDAALDEANVERYTRMVRDFLGSTQFLIVTHNKRTMAVADTLYGVTMEGKGISRAIAVRFEQEKAREHAAGP